MKKIFLFQVAKYYFCSFKPCRLYHSRPKSHNMPKNKKHIQDLKEHRMKIRIKNEKKTIYFPSEVYLNALSNGKRGSPGSLYVHCGGQRYLFNCGEGTQRFAHEYKAKLAKLENVFFTYNRWENIGGLPGLTLTVQDMGMLSLTLHGPQGIDDIYNMTKGFLLTREIETKGFSGEIFTDGAMTVKAIKIKGNKKKSYDAIEDDEDYKWVDENRRECEFLHEKRRKISGGEEFDMAVSYICKLKPKQGHLNLEECVNAGVPPGPLLGKLKNGEDIKLPDGRIVYSKDVTNPDEVGPLFIVLEIPSEEFLLDLDTCTDWTKYHLDVDSNENFPHVIAHFTSPSIVNHPKYQDWMSKFSSKTLHLMLNGAQDSPNSIAIHRIQHQLNFIHPEIFPFLKTNMEMGFQDIMKRFYLRPKKGLVYEESSNIKPDHFFEDIDRELLENELQVLRSKIPANVPGSIESNEYPEIVFLGTGSSIPSKVRNTSGILLHISEESSVLLDVGEGIFGQMINFYGKKSIDETLAKLSCIFISHLHADHHLGLIQIIKERHRAFSKLGKSYKNLQVIAPLGMMTWLKAYDRKFEPICHLFDLRTNNQFVQDEVENDEQYLSFLERHSLKLFNTVRVKHCREAYGIVITHLNGMKIVYSGDTMPCQSLVDAGKDCDVLIHEATMEDDLEEDAKYKAHSTTSQAISIGQSMNARYTILTHFSQRYAKVPLFNDNFCKNIGIAFDNMKIRPRDLPVLPLLHPALKVMFADHYSDLENRKAKRQLQKEKEKLLNE